MSSSSPLNTFSAFVRNWFEPMTRQHVIATRPGLYPMPQFWAELNLYIFLKSSPRLNWMRKSTLQ